MIVSSEIFVETIAMNSEVVSRCERQSPLRLLSRGRRPAVLGIADLDSLRASPKLLARTFDVTEDSEIPDAIDRVVLNVR